MPEVNPAIFEDALEDEDEFVTSSFDHEIANPAEITQSFAPSNSPEQPNESPALEDSGTIVAFDSPPIVEDSPNTLGEVKAQVVSVRENLDTPPLENKISSLPPTPPPKDYYPTSPTSKWISYLSTKFNSLMEKKQCPDESRHIVNPDISPSHHHYLLGMAHLEAQNYKLALSEYILSATIGSTTDSNVDPHPESMRCIIELYSAKSSPVYDRKAAAIWTQKRLMVLSSPEGMIAQANVLRNFESWGPIPRPGSVWDSPGDLEAAEMNYPKAFHVRGIFLRDNEQYVDSLDSFHRAVDLGHTDSEEWIAEAYEQGIGIQPNLDAGKAWRDVVNKRKARMAKVIEKQKRDEERRIEMYKAESELYAFSQKQQAEQTEQTRLKIWQQRKSDTMLSSAISYLEWGYFAIGFLSKHGNEGALNYLNPETTTIPKVKKSSDTIFFLASHFANTGNHEYASKWFEIGAELNHHPSQLSFATYLITGMGVTADPGKAISWLHKAYEQGNSEAALVLGQCYTRGIGVLPDSSKAVLWYTRAWNQGKQIEAAFAVGLAYSTGFVPEKSNDSGTLLYYCNGKDESGRLKPIRLDPELAVDWYEKAALCGHPKACNNLGEIFMCGRGVCKNEQIGFTYFKKAADLGLCEAKYNLARCYQEGLGCLVNEEEAKKLFAEVANQGLFAEE